MFGGLRHGGLTVVEGDWVGYFGDPHEPLQAHIEVKHPRFYRRALLGGDVALGEAWMDGDWESLDLVAVIRLAVRNLDQLESSHRLASGLARAGNRLLHRRNGNTRQGSRSNIAAHYDLGNEFYRLFLDRTMAYSCAIFEDAEEPLDVAQRRKFDRICRKLQLGPRDHLLEIGTGWGGFAVYAALKYGCRITTTTISRRQYEYTADLLQRSGIGADRVLLLCEDYRDLKGQFNKLVSIEMFEAVGLEHYDEFFGACDRLLDAEGCMLLQTITMNERTFPQYRRSCDWIQKYIFPGAELASVAEIQRSLARLSNLSLYHMEEIGQHYAQTLARWRSAFHRQRAQLQAQGFDESFRRQWDYYFAYCEGAFRERHIGDAQLLLTRRSRRAPLPGEEWMAAPSSAN